MNNSVIDNPQLVEGQSAQAADFVLQAQSLGKTYNSGPQQITVWQDVDLSVRAGERVAIVGASGSGKTTLLNALGGLDSIDQGKVLVGGQDLFALNEGARTQLRNQKIGFVYQFHHLLAEFSALENVMLPLLLAGQSRRQARLRASECLKQMGLADRVKHNPAELSGGERQRTAIARALANRPALLLLDEPTGNLDQQTAAQVEQAMVDLTSEVESAFVLVTHDQQLAARMDRTLHLIDQTLQSA